MSNLIEYKELMAFHPGYYIAEVIEDMGISQAEFATRLGTTPKTLSTLINGQISLSNDLAMKLSAMLGTSAEVWLNLQKGFDEKKIEIQAAKDKDEQVEIVNLIDYSFFEKVAGLPPTKDISERIGNLCKYLRVANLKILLHPDFLVNFRTGVSDFQIKNMINSRAWLQTAINCSQGIQTQRFNAEKLKSYLPELRSMTVQKPEVFMPRMREIFADCGVAFVLLPTLKNSGVNGAVKWISNERVVLAINNRRLYADVFWFSLFHEIRHVLQQKVKTVFVSCKEKEMMEINSALEDDADKFARDFLIPRVAMQKFNPSNYITDAEIVSFAESIGIHPGIVVGRLQHDKLIHPSRCAKLKEKYEVKISVN